MTKSSYPRSSSSALVRNLDEIQEVNPGQPRSRTAALVLASFGGASIVFVALFMMKPASQNKVETSDPLGDLVARTHPAGAARSDYRLGSSDVSFPAVLSDQKRPTTAMELVRSERELRRKRKKKGVAVSEPIIEPTDTPSDADAASSRESVERDPLRREPLPAGDLLGSDNGGVAERDKLRRQANAINDGKEQGGAMVDAGHAGGYQLQVSSFKSLPDAEAFALALRRRGHRAFVESAEVKGRGTWHRVRIGPFKYKRSATIYRQDFEAKERLVTFIVNPPKTRIRIGLSED